MKNIKRSFKIAILSIFVGSIQMVIFLPDGSYCDDLSSDVISGIFRFMPIQFIIMFFNSYIFKSYDKYTSLFVLLFLWLYINKIEFTKEYDEHLFEHLEGNANYNRCIAELAYRKAQAFVDQHKTDKDEIMQKQRFVLNYLLFRFKYNKYRK